ncbi:hypothetical protein PIB30_050075 [Stylosanthes scabra]|uniref:Uncharacterized protein n=1 Tax=Stylosanthes scabra TaxID=79078 RepID=A0ABU6VIC2_9FABA|nr:hypothetical protein [Stylosanthes scabra]
MADNNQHFKVRATFAAKGVFDVTPSESTIMAKSLVDIAAMLKEIKEGQAANSTFDTTCQHLSAKISTQQPTVLPTPNNDNKTSSANHTHTTNHKTHKTKDTNHLILDKPTLHQMFLHPIMKKLSVPINKKVGR